MKTPATAVLASVACLLLGRTSAAPAMRGSVEAPRDLAPAVNGTRLMNMINCFAWYMENAAHRSDNSHTDGCDQESIVYCHTDRGTDDHFCKFSGTNVLEVSSDTPTCFFNCQMETCDAWTYPHNADQQKCVDALSAP